MINQLSTDVVIKHGPYGGLAGRVCARCGPHNQVLIRLTETSNYVWIDDNEVEEDKKSPEK